MNDISFEVPDSDERGVSPVIGVILMVAITVILAAVIASFVLGFGGSVSSNASAGVEVDTSGVSPYTVTIISMGDNTQSVECSAGSGSANSVGATFTCSDGENIVAIGEGNTGDATIRTDI